MLEGRRKSVDMLIEIIFTFFFIVKLPEYLPKLSPHFYPKKVFYFYVFFFVLLILFTFFFSLVFYGWIIFGF